MDLFYECLPFSEKQRIHFHRFMLSIHEELECLQRVRNPLDRIAARIAEKTKVLCVDEFFVMDIGDAMLLSGLLEGLFKRCCICCDVKCSSGLSIQGWIAAR